MRIFLAIVLLYLLSGGASGQGISTFELWDDANGLPRTGYQVAIENLVNTIHDSLPVSYTGNFKVYDAGVYLLASKFKDNYVQKCIDDFENKANNLNTPYLLMIRELTEMDGLYGRVHIRLKLPEDHYTINENASIKYLLEDFFNTNLLNKKSFEQTYTESLILFKSKIGPGRTIFNLNTSGAMQQAGFSRHPAGIDVKFVTDTSHGTVGLIEDFSRLKMKVFNGNTEDKFLRNSAQLFCGTDTRVIFTSEFSTQQDLVTAQASFENFTESFSIKTMVWIHVYREEEINGNTPWLGTFYFKAKSALTADELFQSAEVDAIRLKGNNIDIRDMNCANLNSWRSNPCFFDAFPNVDKTFMFGMVSGLIDEGLNTITTIMLILQGTINAVTDSSFWDYTKTLMKIGIAFKLNDYSILNHTDFKILSDIFDSIDIVKDFILNLYDIFDEVINKDLIYSLAGAVHNTMVELIGEIVNFTFEGGLFIGGIVFEIIINFFTGGSGSLSKLGSKGLTEIFSKLKNPAEVSDLIKKSWNKNGKRELKCKILGKGCFMEDTPVLMAGNNLFKVPVIAYSMAFLPVVSPIQDVKPDDIVKAYHHEDSYYATADNNDKVYISGWQDYDYLDITPTTWQIGTFEIIESTGSKVEVEANRPKTWYQENGVYAIGDKAHFYMPEIGINGEATLLSVRPTTVNTTNIALNESGMVDRPVITTFKRYAPVVYDYYFSDGGVIGATQEHPFFSVDRQAYIAVGELKTGEQVMTAGEKVVKFISGKLRDKGEPVYNFEVWREHNYYVGSKEQFNPSDSIQRIGEWLLVHNTCPSKLIREVLESTALRIKKINGKLEIPNDWIKKDVLRNGKVVGSRYEHPTNPKIQIRLHDKGDLPHKPHNYDKPYARYELGKDANGIDRHADIDGNMVELNDPEYYEKTHFLIEGLDVE